MGDFNFRIIDWETHLTKEGEMLGQSEGLKLIDITRDQLITFPTSEDKTLDLIFTNTPGLANNCHLPDKFSDHSAVACTLNTSIPFKRKPRRKVYLFNKCSTNNLNKSINYIPHKANQASMLWEISTLERLIGRHTFLCEVLGQSEGLKLIDIARDHYLDYMGTAPTNG